MEIELKALLAKRAPPPAGSAATAPTPRVPVSWGKLLDKVTILEIKTAKLAEPLARANVARELALLAGEVAATLAGNAELQRLKAELKEV